MQGTLSIKNHSKEQSIRKVIYRSPVNRKVIPMTTVIRRVIARNTVRYYLADLTRHQAALPWLQALEPRGRWLALSLDIHDHSVFSLDIHDQSVFLT